MSCTVNLSCCLSFSFEQDPVVVIWILATRYVESSEYILTPPYLLYRLPFLPCIRSHILSLPTRIPTLFGWSTSYNHTVHTTCILKSGKEKNYSNRKVFNLHRYLIPYLEFVFQKRYQFVES